jgi:ATP synthase F1 gamma subunit
MASLKDMRVRIASTKATQKITKAMQMVAASKLRRAQSAAEAARPYAERMDAVIGNIAAAAAGSGTAPARTMFISSWSAPGNAACRARSTRPSCGSRASARSP